VAKAPPKVPATSPTRSKLKLATWSACRKSRRDWRAPGSLCAARAWKAWAGAAVTLMPKRSKAKPVANTKSTTPAARTTPAAPGKGLWVSSSTPKLAAKATSAMVRARRAVGRHEERRRPPNRRRQTFAGGSRGGRRCGIGPAGFPPRPAPASPLAGFPLWGRRAPSPCALLDGHSVRTVIPARPPPRAAEQPRSFPRHPGPPLAFVAGAVSAPAMRSTAPTQGRLRCTQHACARANIRAPGCRFHPES
jgi:hypothetical protein